MTIKTYTVEITRTTTYQTKVKAVSVEQAKSFALGKAYSADPNEYVVGLIVFGDDFETEILDSQEVSP